MLVAAQRPRDEQLEAARAVVGNIKCDGFYPNISRDGSFFQLHISHAVKEVKGAYPTNVGYSRWFRSDVELDDLVFNAYLMCHELARHEIDEQFHYNGKQFVEPHPEQKLKAIGAKT